jgi:hypothetical protein
MKTLVIIAHHHGAFLTIESAKQNSSHDHLVVLIPRSQIEKYNGFYEENISDPEYACFQNYEKKITEFVEAETFVLEEYDISNPISCVSEALMAMDRKGVHLVVGAGTLILKDPFTEEIEDAMAVKKVGISSVRVYHDNPRLNMYQMLDMGNHDGGTDANVFILNLDLFDQVYSSDNILCSEKRFLLDRSYNMRNDYLIGTAISAHESVKHGIKAVSSHIINFWSIAMKKYENLYSEETFSYPLDYYSAYAEKVKQYLPESTFNNILENGAKTKYWIEDIRKILS